MFIGPKLCTKPITYVYFKKSDVLIYNLLKGKINDKV